MDTAKFYSALNCVSSKSTHSLILLAALNGREIILHWSKLFLYVLWFIFCSSDIDSLNIGFSFKQQKKVRSKDILSVMVTSHSQMYFIFVLVNISNSHIKDTILSERFSFDKVYNFENSPLMAMPTPS